MLVKICKRGPTNVNGSHFNIIDTHSRGSDPEGSAARYYILQGRRHKLKFLERTPEEEAQEIPVRISLLFADDLQPVPSAGSNANEGPLINFGRGSQSMKACTEIVGTVKDKSGETDFTFGVASLSYFWSRRWFKLKVEFGDDNLQPKEGIHIYVVTHARLLDLHAPNRGIPDQMVEEGDDAGEPSSAPRGRGVKRELAKLMSPDYGGGDGGDGHGGQGMTQHGVDMSHAAMMGMGPRMMPGGAPDGSSGYYQGGSAAPMGLPRPPKRPRAEDLLSEGNAAWRPGPGPPFGQPFMQAGHMPMMGYGQYAPQYFAPVPPQGYMQAYNPASPGQGAPGHGHMMGHAASAHSAAVTGMMGLASGSGMAGGRSPTTHVPLHPNARSNAVSPAPLFGGSYPQSPGLAGPDVPVHDAAPRSSANSPTHHGSRRPDAVAQLLDFQENAEASQPSFAAKAAAAATAAPRISPGGAVSPGLQFSLSSMAGPHSGGGHSGSTPPQPSRASMGGSQAPAVHVVPTCAELRDVASLSEGITESGEVPGIDGGEAYLAELRKRAASVEEGILEGEGQDAHHEIPSTPLDAGDARRPLRPVAYVPVFDSPRLLPPYLVSESEAAEIAARLERLYAEGNWEDLAIGLSVPTVLHTALFRERSGRARLAALLRAVRSHSTAPNAMAPASPANKSSASAASSVGSGVLTAASVGVTGIAKGLYLALLQAPFEYDSRQDALRVVEAICNYATVFSSERRHSSPDLFEAPWADVGPLFAKARSIAAKAFGEVSYMHTLVLARQADAMTRYGRLKEALAHYLKAWSQTPRLPGSGHGASASQHLVTELHRNLAECYGTLGQMEGWDQTLLEALEMRAVKEEDRVLEASVLCTRGNLALYSQRLDRARSIYDSLLASCHTLPGYCRLDRAWFLALRTLACILQGDLAAAFDSWRQAVEVVAHVGDFGQPDSDLVGALLLFLRNAPFEPAVREAARWTVAWSLALLTRAADRLGETPTEALALSHLAAMFAERGRWALAAAAGREAQQGLTRFRGHFAGKTALHERLQTCLDTASRRLRDAARAAAPLHGGESGEAGLLKGGPGGEHAAAHPLGGVTITIKPRAQPLGFGGGAGVMGPPPTPGQAEIAAGGLSTDRSPS
eukprot:tig00020610_g12019.t1